MLNPSRPRILVIDDTPSILDDFRKILCAPSTAHAALDDLAAAVFGAAATPAAAPTFEVDCAQQGRDGLALVTAAVAAGRPYAVAFVDMRMPPGWDGLETIVQLWAVDPNLQVVICTAHSDHSWSAITQRLGQTDKLLILKKPFDHVEALQLAHALSKKWEITLRDQARIEHLDQTVATRTRELRAAEERFTIAFNASPLGLAIQALDDGTVLDVNAAHCEIFGRPASEMVGRSPEQLGKLLDNARWHQLLGKLARGESLDEVPFEYPSPKNGLRQLRTSARPISIAGRSCAVWAVRDVTAEKALESQFLQSQKMEAIGQLAAGVAHDFNNILTIILSYTSLLVFDEDSLSPDHRNYVGQVQIAANRAASLTRQLLVFSRRQVTKPAPLDLNTTLENLRKMLARLVPERITLAFELAPHLPVVIADEANIEHVVMNLVVNARDALPDNGSITLRTRPVVLDEAAAALRPGARPGTFVSLAVADTGTGIPPEVRPKIFEPFFTTKPVGQGTGLGLSTVYGIVKQHDGWIEVKSEVNQGTTFELFFPATAPSAGAPSSPLGTKIPDRIESSGRGERILVVEDDPSVRRSACAAAVRAGYRVTEASDGPSAIAAWEAAGHRFDLLFTDVVMPNGISGVELAQRLRRDEPTLRVVFTTGYSDALRKGEGNQLGSAPILFKPYEVATLLRYLRTALASESTGPRAAPAGLGMS